MHAPSRAAAAGALAVTAAGLTGLATAGGASAAPVRAAAAASAADSSFATMNEQGNLAEISLGNLALSKSQNAQTRALATKTIADHQLAKSKLTSVASAAKVTLPTTPSPAQLAVAAQLKAAPASSFDLMYAQAQVTAHQQAIAGAKTEQSTTGNAQFKGYASFYIPVASMHLSMAQDEVSSLHGTPTGVPAGSGGAASTGSSLDAAGLWGIGAGSVLVAAGAALAVTRRRGTATR